MTVIQNWKHSTKLHINQQTNKDKANVYSSLANEFAHCHQLLV